MAIQFTDLGFATSYEIEINPEFPAAGDWGVSEFRFGRRTGEMLTIKIRPQVAKAWVASYSVEARAGVVGLYGCPSAQQLLVASGIDAYLIQVAEPGKADHLPVSPVRSVRRPSGTDLVVVGSFTHLAAVDGEGLRWVTEQLFLDDLELVEGPPGRIYVRGSIDSILGDPELLVIDADRGEVLEGPWNAAIGGPHGPPRWRRSGT